TASYRFNRRPVADTADTPATRRRPDTRPGIPASPDSPDTVVSFSSFQRSQTRRQGRPENIGALSGNPQVERQMQQLCYELEINSRKLESLRNQSAASARASDGARMEGLRIKKRQLAAQLKNCMRVLDPDLSGTVMERAKSQATI